MKIVFLKYLLGLLGIAFSYTGFSGSMMLFLCGIGLILISLMVPIADISVI